MRRRGASLLEVCVAVTLLASMMMFVSGAVVGAQRHVGEATALTATSARLRGLVERLEAELRDANLHPEDLEPGAPYESPTLAWRRVAGVDDAGRPELVPSRGSDRRCRVRLEGRRVLLDTAAGLQVTLAERIDDLRFTLEVDLLRIRAVAREPDAAGGAVERSAEVVVRLRNRIAVAD